MQHPHPGVTPATRALHPAPPLPRQALSSPQLHTMNACSPGPCAAPRPRPRPLISLPAPPLCSHPTPQPDTNYLQRAGHKSPTQLFLLSPPLKTSLSPLNSQAPCICLTRSSALWPPAADEPASASALRGVSRAPGPSPGTLLSPGCFSAESPLLVKKVPEVPCSWPPSGTLNLNHTNSLLSN